MSNVFKETKVRGEVNFVRLLQQMIIKQSISQKEIIYLAMFS